MRHSRCVNYRSFTIGLMLCLGWLGAALQVAANPVYSDERSLSNGAQLYDLHCSECHGSDTTDRSTALTDADAGNSSAPKSPALPKVTPRLTAPPTTADWPEWAERPDPNAQEAAAARAQALDEINALIEGSRPSAVDPAVGNTAPGNSGKFSPGPGATNLADPSSYFYGTSEEEVFNSIANGTGAAMPGWHDELGGDEAIWDLVNYIRSFWDEEWLY